jgi:hypothetical protein
VSVAPRLRALALAAVITLPSLAHAASVRPLDDGKASVTFPRGTPAAQGRGETLWTVKDGAETFLAGGIPTPANPDLVTRMRACPAPVESAQGKLSCRTWEQDGDLAKETRTELPSGDLVVVRLLFHDGRSYEAMYSRRGGAGPISADGAAFLNSLRANH